jgi:hypothetical protein
MFMEMLSHWVACHVIVCVPTRLFDIAEEAVSGARKRIFHDPVLTDVASVEVCSYPSEEEFGKLPSAEEPVLSPAATLIYDELTNAASRPALSAAPAAVFCLLIIGYEEEIHKILKDMVAYNGFTALPVNTRSLVEDDREQFIGIFGSITEVSLEREILHSIGSTLEKAESDHSFRIARGSAFYSLPSTKDREIEQDVGEHQQGWAGISSSFAGLHSTVTKARSQLVAMKSPTPAKTIDQASLNMQSIQLLYMVTVTGSPSGMAKGGLKWAESLALKLAKRISAVESGDPVGSSWYVSFISAGETIYRLVPPIPVDAVARRQVRTRQLGYDFDFRHCAHEVTALIKNDIASFARRGTGVTSVRTVIFSTELPLADTETVEAYHELFALTPLAWVLSGEAGELSDEFVSDHSRVFSDHSDVVEEMVSVMFDSNALASAGRHALWNGAFPALPDATLNSDRGPV